MKIKYKILLAFAVYAIITVSLLYLTHFNIIPLDIKSGKTNLILLIAAVFFAGILLAALISRDIKKNIKNTKNILKNFFNEKENNEKKYSSKTEFNEIYENLRNMKKLFISVADFAEELSEGNYKAKLNTENKNRLVKALINIKDNLETAEKERKYNIKELNRNKWYQTGVTEFTILLQQNFKNTEEMSYPVVKKLAEHIGAEQAGIFILKNKKQKQILHLEAAYAYDKKKMLDTEMEIGESLVGKCAKNKEMIKIDDLPEGYTYISSGLGEDTPRTLLLMPLIYENNLFGVLEIASLKNIPEYKINFIKVISERIAAEIYNIETKILTAKLSEDRKMPGEEILKIKSEKEKIFQENKKIKEELSKIYENFGKIIIDNKGTIKEINKNAENIYKIKQENSINQNISKISEKHGDFNKIKEALKNKNTYKRTLTNTGNKKIQEIYISENNENIILLSTDIN